MARLQRYIHPHVPDMRRWMSLADKP